MIWELTIRRPVLTVVVFLVLAIFGLWGYFHMPVRENPDIEFPIVSVNVVLPGAEPQVVETEIIEPLEEQINTVEGLKALQSTAREQVGQITAEFQLYRDVDIAAQDVRDRVDRARRELPEDIEAPIVRKVDPDARAVMWIALTGDERWDAVRLTRYADEVLKEQLANLRGAARIQIGGERLYAVRVRLDADKLAAHGVTVQDVVATIQANNVDIPSGRIESEQREFLIRTKGQFSSPEPINDLMITVRDGRPIRIDDVGEAVAGVENDRQTGRFAGGTAVGLGVVKQSDANTVALTDAVEQRMKELAEDFPPGLSYAIAADDSTYVEQNVHDLVTTIFMATGLVVLVVLGFLRTGWGTLITSLAIPTSLLAGLAVAFAMGFSLNTLTLLALILAIGIVIDDAVVVLESVYRHQEEGAEPIPAARVGTNEIAFAAIANTLALASVFLPVAFTAGIIGRFFFEFGITTAVTVFASTFTALTLTPMLCSRLLRVPRQPGRVRRWSRAFEERLEAGYAWGLDRAFDHRWLTLLIAVAALVSGVYLGTRLSTEFLPTADRAEFIIRFETPEGSTLRYTDAYAREIETLLDETEGLKHHFLAIGLGRGGGPGQVNRGITFVKLVPAGERERHQREIAQEIREKLAGIPNGRAYVIEGGGGLGAGAPLQLVLQHEALDELAAEQETLMAWMRDRPQYLGVNSNLKMNRPQVRVSIRRDKASELDVSVAAISNTMRLLLGEPDISEIERGTERYQIIPEITAAGRMTPSDLGDLYVRSRAGELVAMSNLVDIEQTIGPSEIHHYNRLRSATISASTPPGVALGDALTDLERHIADALPDAFRYSVAGEAEDFRESFYYLRITLAFAVLFIYLVLAAQFESWLQPLVILGALPLATVGALGMLWALGMTLNIFSFIGLIMLLGMATKNAILMIDYTNVLRGRGRAMLEATKEAARVRFRPVVMTTISTVLGLMPIALAYGAGGEARAPLGVAITSGLLATTLLTLLVIPVAYSLLSQAQTIIAHGWQGERDDGEQAHAESNQDNRS